MGLLGRLLGWESTIMLRHGRAGHACFDHGQRLMVVGGGGAGGYAGVECATIGPAGELGPFGDEPHGLVTGRRSFSFAVSAEDAYAIGGWGAQTELWDGERLRLNPGRRPGRFEVLPGFRIANSRQNGAGIALGRSVYRIGGGHWEDDAYAALTTIERGTIRADGSLEPLELEPGCHLRTPRESPAVLQISHWLYVFGGLWTGPYDSGGKSQQELGSVERAPIDADGGLGAFEVVRGVSLRCPRYAHTVTRIGNRLYAIGGRTLSGTLGNVEVASIDPAGELTGFRPLPAVRLCQPRARHTTVSLGPHLYVIGGETQGYRALRTIERLTHDGGEPTEPFALSW